MFKEYEKEEGLVELKEKDVIEDQEEEAKEFK